MQTFNKIRSKRLGFLLISLDLSLRHWNLLHNGVNAIVGIGGILFRIFHIVLMHEI